MRVLLLLGLLPVCLGFKILGIIPTPSYSHQMPFLAIMKELALRGHQVTVVTTHPLKDAPANMTQIDLAFSYELLKDQMKFMKMSRDTSVARRITEHIIDRQLQSEQIQQLIKSGEKFDVVVMELFGGWSYLGVVRSLGSPPLVGFLSAGSTFFGEITGNPPNPAYVPWIFTGHTDHMSFMERVSNTIQMMTFRVVFKYLLLPAQEKLMIKHFGDDAPNFWDMAYNVSLVVACNDFVLGYPMPITPNIVEVTGLNVQTGRKPLPKDIKAFLDGAEHGVIYMSLGSNVKSKDMPEEKLQAFLKAFSSLPQRVLWKWEDDSLPGKPDNVMVSKWMPQQDVLAHPKVLLFVTQGGLQSFGEAAYNAVPLVGIPFMGDQFHNVAKMKTAGIGTKLDFDEIASEQTVLKALKMVLDDPSYASNMRRLSSVFREHQAMSLDRATWWIEYVARHNGAKHLRPASLDLAWYQLLLLDVILFVVGVASVALFVTYKLVKFIGRKIFGRQDRKLKAQ